MLRVLNPSPLRVRPACRTAAGGPPRAVPQRQPPVRRPSGNRLCSPWRGSAAAPAPAVEVDGEAAAATGARGELEAFLEVVPAMMRRGLARELVEVVMDLGRRPIARFPSGDRVISDHPVAADDLRRAVSKVQRTNNLFHCHSAGCTTKRTKFSLKKEVALVDQKYLGGLLFP
jgi:hypothetical protein